MIVWLISCTVERLDTGYWTLEYQNPTIDTVEVECEDSQWQINVWTDHWTGNGLLWIADENRYERHTLYSVSASPTGDSDRLRASLSIVSDWRDFQSGRSSGFSCTEQNHLGFFVGIRHPQTAQIADCAEYIDDENFLDEPTLDLWGQVPLPDCPLTDLATTE